MYLYPSNHGCVEKAPQRRGGRGERVGMDPTFSEIVIYPGCFPGNLTLCHSPRHPTLCSPMYSRILSGALEKFQICGVNITGRDICEPKIESS